jgi:hypothetical protein
MSAWGEPLPGMTTLKQEIDDIIFRCFAQGQYWGTEKDGKLDPDYKPERPIDRTEANQAIIAYIEKLVGDYEKLDQYPSNSNANTRKRGRNDLRREIRNKLKGIE